MIAKLMAMVDGSKTYLLLIALFVITLFTGDTSALNLEELVTNPENITSALYLAIVGAFRSALAKVGK